MIRTILISCLLGFSVSAAAGSEIFLGASPSVAGDGSAFAFEWNDHIWWASTAGGEAKRLIAGPGRDVWPVVSPDGRRVAFESDRDGGSRLYEYDFGTDRVRALTTHSEYTSPRAWTPDGTRVVAHTVRDDGDDLNCLRLALFDTARPGKRELLFDAPGREPSVSPDGTKVLFTYRAETDIYRKRRRSVSPGHGQIWLYDTVNGSLTMQIDNGHESRNALWCPDGRSFYYLSDLDGVRNLYCHPLERGFLDFGKDRQLTFFTDDHICHPSLSSDGHTLVFRKGVDFFRLDPTDEKPEAVRIALVTPPGYEERPPVRRRFYEAGWDNDADGDVAFRDNGSEVAFTTGGDLYVMDTKRREPKLVQGSSRTHERECVFSPDGQTLYYISDRGDGSDLWKAERTDASRPWCENADFRKTLLASDDVPRRNFSISPKGDRFAWQNARGVFTFADTNGTVLAKGPASTLSGGYAWSPDGHYVVAQQADEFLHYDIHVIATMTGESWRISRNHRYDGQPVWSPDGEIIAWVSEDPEAEGGETYLSYVYLDRALEEREMRDSGSVPTNPPPLKVQIPFSELSERVRMTKIRAQSPFFSWNSRTVGFRSGAETKTVRLPDAKDPRKLFGKTGVVRAWLEKDNRVLWVVDRKPACNEDVFGYRVRQTTDLADYQELVFRSAWAMIRDEYYDPDYHGADWTAVRDRLLPYARAARSMNVFRRVVYMMLGELDSSHLGFMASEQSRKEWEGQRTIDAWREESVHLGLRFDPSFTGPGWRIRDVLEGTPADRVEPRLEPGDVVTAVDGSVLGEGDDPLTVLTGPAGRTFRLTVGTNEVQIKSVSYATARQALGDRKLRTNREKVHETSQGRFGYLHVAQMNTTSFRKFQAEVFSEGYGREGLIVDVRGNTGGFTADQMLQILCGSDHSRAVYRSDHGEVNDGYLFSYWRRPVWAKPIVVLTDENANSNAEIFSHAIKTLKRGKLVGRETAGNVIATNDRPLLDFGTFRNAHIGWFRLDGTDMEHHGAVPDVPVDILPTDYVAGRDPQLARAVEVLEGEVRDWKKSNPPIRYKYAR